MKGDSSTWDGQPADGSLMGLWALIALGRLIVLVRFLRSTAPATSLGWGQPENRVLSEKKEP